MKMLLLFFSTPFFLGACAQEEADHSSGNLEGVQWLAECFSNNGVYQSRTITFNGGSYQAQSTIYVGGTTCGTPGVHLVEKGTYVLGDVISSTSSIRKLNKTYADLSLTPLTQTAANSYNSSSHCGLSNWVMNVPQRILGLNCTGTQMPTIGMTYYDVFLIWTVDIPGAGIEKGELNFGLFDNVKTGVSEATRPTSVTSPDYKRVQ
ncbi:hypothetical protein D3C87_123610 [compost metagenome]